MTEVNCFRGKGPMNKFNVETKIFGNVAILYPKGYLNNLAAEGLEKECDACIGKGIRNIVLNLNGIELINSIGISILLGVIEKVKGTDGTLCFTNLSKLHADTFQMLGLTKYMKVFASDEEAISHLRAH